jgi:hypothetical protein
MKDVTFLFRRQEEILGEVKGEVIKNTNVTWYIKIRIFIVWK